MVDKKKSHSPSDQISRAARARKTLLQWHESHGRHELPWRKRSDPYAVLVSEFMLQQTTVTTVTPRFHAWMKRFPAISDLAVAEEQEVLAAWEGLGYYSRARRLHAAARSVMEHHLGEVPVKESDLLALPGVGAYTAAAIRAFAHDQHAVVLDTNIIRVLARWGNMITPIDTAAGRSSLEAIADNFFPKTGCRSLASALMDLGAMICTSGMPDCKECPLKNTCAALAPETLPKKSPRAVITKLLEHRACFQRGDHLYLEQSMGPRWRGLWILPDLGSAKPSGRALAEITYPITRYRVTMKVHPVKSAIPSGLKGFSQEELAKLPIPSPHRRAIAAILHTSHTNT
jgi:A/G-specific adenine glycosylase